MGRVNPRDHGSGRRRRLLLGAGAGALGAAGIAALQGRASRRIPSSAPTLQALQRLIPTLLELAGLDGAAVRQRDSEFAAGLATAAVNADRWMPLRALLAGHPPLPRRSHPALFRGVHTGRHMFARYFRPDQHHDPADWDTDAATRSLILELNQRTRELVAAEVGQDLGDELPGPSWMKRL